MKGVELYARLSAELVDEDIRFLRWCYYTKIIDAGNRLLLLHGGIPATSKLDLGQDYPYQGYAEKPPKGLDLLTRTRHLDANGNLVSMDMQTEGSPYWADVYDGRWGFVVFGHEPFIQPDPRRFDHSLGIDTGCVFGGWLTAVSISMEFMGCEFAMVSVKSYDVYSNAIYE